MKPMIKSLGWEGVLTLLLNGFSVWLLKKAR